jgi:hypothetical protein
LETTTTTLPPDSARHENASGRTLSWMRLPRTLPVAMLLLAEACAGGHSAGEPQFRADVMPLFEHWDCGRAGCHGPDASAGTLQLSGPAEDVYASLVTTGVLVFTTNVDAAPILAAPSSDATGVVHAGGKLWSNDDSAYQTLRAWILAGAPDN